MNLRDKKVLVCGGGKSGISAAKLLSKAGSKTTLQDNKDFDKLDIDKQSMEKMGISFIIGRNPSPEEIQNFDLLVVSPGLPMTLPHIKTALDCNIDVIGEIELASLFVKGKIIGITGTNGKTTTTTLVGQLLKTVFENTYIVGNIGIPFCDYVYDSDDSAIFVVEISSYMLETIKRFRPNISCVLNITEDHISRHITFENYVNAKKRIFENQTSSDIAILNYDDMLTQKMANDTKAKTIFFSLKTCGDHFIFVRDGCIFENTTGVEREIIKLDQIYVLGEHNVYNILASIGIALSLNVPIHKIFSAIQNFKGVEHRIEYVRTLNGVDYYNDSKGTNVDASIKAIDAMVKPTILIIGGSDKQVSFVPLIQAFSSKIKHVIFLGDVTNQLVQTAKEYNFTRYTVVSDYKSAVDLAFSKAQCNDAVLLSPACASFDMFTCFEHRGSVFKELVNALSKC